jgi:hypothetical protein
MKTNIIIESVIYLLESEDKKESDDKDKTIKKFGMAKKVIVQQKNEAIRHLIDSYKKKFREMKDKKGSLEPFKDELENAVKLLSHKYDEKLKDHEDGLKKAMDTVKNEHRAKKKVYLTAAAATIGGYGAYKAYKYYKNKKQQSEDKKQ